MKYLSLLLLLSNFSLAAPAAKKIKVVTTLPVLASLAREVGGQHVELSSLLTASIDKAEDPHVIKDKPTFKSLVSKADLFIQVGRSLELWAPLVIKASANPKLISGEALLNASSGILTLEVPTTLSRAHGDVHPQGNPHVWLSPSAALKMSENIKNMLIKIDILHKKDYESNFNTFKHKLTLAMFGAELVKKANNDDFLWRQHEGKKLNEYLSKHKVKLSGWLSDAAQINYSFITYHTVFSYLAHDFNLKIVAHIEEKSGVPPSAAYKNALIKKAQTEQIKHVVVASYYRGMNKIIDYITTKINGRSIFITVDCVPQQSYIDFMSNLLATLIKFK
jgi:zinc/manganese transport system substrate-binding protein